MKQKKSNFKSMSLIICNPHQKTYFNRVLLSFEPDKRYEDYMFICEDSEIQSIFSYLNNEHEFIIIETALNWKGKLLQHFYGFELAAQLRKSFLVKNPIIFFSPLSRNYFENRQGSKNKFQLLNCKGFGFLPFPFSLENFNKQILETKTLNNEELSKVVVNSCGLMEDWESIAHKIGNLITDYQNQQSEIQQIVSKWAVSINNFAPHQKEIFQVFENLIQMPINSVNIENVKQNLEILVDRLLSIQPILNFGKDLKTRGELPNCPPKGFSKVLIADDRAQTSLINALRNEFRYDVLEQANKLSKAKHLMVQEMPDVILSDLYFKRSERETEVPDKSVGDEFIQFALNSPHYKSSEIKKPIVLVTSKAPVRSETDIRAGAINCSGTNRATNPNYIHNVIWAAAMERGVKEPEKIAGMQWGVEYTCRQRLENYETELPKIMRQWRDFQSLVSDTLRLSNLLWLKTKPKEQALVKTLIDILQPYKKIEEYSFDMVTNLFIETDKIHWQAKISPETETKKNVRNILHGKIEQFSSVTNSIEFMQYVLLDVATVLVSLSKYNKQGLHLTKILTEFSKSEPLVPYLKLLNSALSKLLSDLPKLPDLRFVENFEDTPTQSKTVNIIVAEDTPFWREFVITAIEKAKNVIGETYSLNYVAYDNTAEALAAFKPRKQSHAIVEEEQKDVITVAIVDICLPEDKSHTDRIRQAVEGESDEFVTPDSIYGLNLIKELCSYKYNIPLIVFSTIDSIEDRLKICNWGVPENSFISKHQNSEKAIVQALIRFIESSSKYIVKKIQVNNETSRFLINGIEIPLPSELNETFAALYNLRQTTAKNDFSVAEIIDSRGDLLTDEMRGIIHDQIYRIRKLVFETLQRNRVYLDAREFIKTKKINENDQFTYQLNAEVVSLDEEDFVETDIETFKNEICKVLVVENDSRRLGEIIELLESLGYEVKHALNAKDAIEQAISFRPDIICLNADLSFAESVSGSKFQDEFPVLKAWGEIRLALADKSIGSIILIANNEKNSLVAQCAQMEIPISNLISVTQENWLNLFLKKVKDEHRRVFLGEVNDTKSDINEPIIEILDGSDLTNGVLNLLVDNEPFTPKKGSEVAKILGLLLNNPKTLLGFEFIKSSLGKSEPVTLNDPKNWTQRIRKYITKDWSQSFNSKTAKDYREKILESSSKGLKLNVQVIDSRISKF